MCAYYNPPAAQNPIFDPSQFVNPDLSSGSTTGIIIQINELINDTNTIIINDTAIINDIGTVFTSNFNRNNQVSNTLYEIAISGLAPNGLYTGSICLEAQIATNPTTQTDFCFQPGGHLKVETPTGYISTKPTLQPFDGGPFGTYQQLFFTCYADATGTITANYKFITKQTGSGTAVSNYNINQNGQTGQIRLCRIR